MRISKPFLRKLAISVTGYFLFAGVVMGLDGPHSSQPAGPGVIADCDQCHNVMTSGGAIFPKLLDMLCQDCHYAGSAVVPTVSMQITDTHSSRTTDTGYGNWEVDCWSCHNPHELGAGGKYIHSASSATSPATVHVKTIDPLSVPLTSPTTGFAYFPDTLGAQSRDVTISSLSYTGLSDMVDAGGNTTKGLCQVCHLQTTNYSQTNPGHPNYSPGTQPATQDCSSCHSHASNFKVSCFGCHNTTQGAGNVRRQIVDDVAPGDFSRLSHHVYSGPAESVTENDCQVCHQQSNHQLNGDPNVLLKDPDGGADVIFNGTGASVEPVCLGCHDSNGPTAHAAAPFGTTTPADKKTLGADPAAWTNSSHGANLVADACLTCHGGADPTRAVDTNAHGSAQTTLLSLKVNGVTVTLPNAPASADEFSPEENLCYACHDASAGASTNLAPEFAKTSHHPIVDAQQTGIPVECTDCHNTHTAQTGTHVAGSNVHGSVLLGTTGVYPAATQGGALAWNVPTGPPTPPPALQPIFYFRTFAPSNPVPTGYRMTPAPASAGTPWGNEYMQGTAVGGGNEGTGGDERPTLIFPGGGTYALRSFVSGDLGAQTISAGSWNFGLNAQVRAGNPNARFRIYVYVMAPDTTVRAAIYGPTTDTQSFTGTRQQINVAFTGAAATALAGDRLVVEVAVVAGANGEVRINWDRDNTRFGELDPPGSVLVSADPGAGLDLPAPQASWSTVSLQGRASGQPHDGDFEGYACLKCHSSSNGRTGRADLSLLFNPNNAAYHNVVGGKTLNGSVTAFMGTWNSSSKLTCTDCHSNDGAGPAGPHGSSQPKLLKGAWTANTGAAGTSGDLCFGCHDFTVYGDENTSAINVSNWEGSKNLPTRVNLHWEHMTSFMPGVVPVACQTCHVQLPHGYKNRSMLATWTNGATPATPAGDPITQLYAPNSKIQILNWSATPGQWQMSDCQYWDGAAWKH